MKNTILFLLALFAIGWGVWAFLNAADSLWETRAKRAGYYCDDLSLVNPKDYGYCMNLRAEGLKK